MPAASSKRVFAVLALLLGFVSLSGCGCGPSGLNYCSGYAGGHYGGPGGVRGPYGGAGGGWNR